MRRLPPRSTRTDTPLPYPALFRSRRKQEMDAARLVFRLKVGMTAAARTAGVREDQNLLRAVHERLCLGDIGTGATGLKLLAPIASDDQPTGDRKSTRLNSSH